MDPQSLDNHDSNARQIDRVALACIQCRSRHVKCDATQPVCTRCKRDGKECTYKKSRRGGLDKAALARRRLKLQQQAELERQHANNTDNHSSHGSSHSGELEDHVCMPNIDALHVGDASLAFKVDPERLVGFFYENFWPMCPVPLPMHFMTQRSLTRFQGKDAELVTLVMKFIGAIYAPWTTFAPYYQAVLQAVAQEDMPTTGFTIQALLMLAIAQYHLGHKNEARQSLNDAIRLGLELQINTKDFAYRCGEGDPVLEESWRRTYYLLHITDQHFAVLDNTPFWAMRDVPNEVDLPCDDEYYESGQILPPGSWQEYAVRELADFEVVYSSLVYLYDIGTVVTYVMKSILATGTFDEALSTAVDAKVAAWQSLLPSCKKDPLRADGKVDEIMFQAHLISAIVMIEVHRTFSALAYSPEEQAVRSFRAHMAPPGGYQKQNRSAHTARALKAVELQTSLLSIQCPAERHSLFATCIVSEISLAQISACKLLLDEHAMSIARDRIRLSIGFLTQMGTVWPLAKEMARDVRYVARRTLSNVSTARGPEPDPAAEVEVPRDELIWPLHSSASIDIYSAMVLPPSWDIPDSDPFAFPPSTMA